MPDSVPPREFWETSNYGHGPAPDSPYARMIDTLRGFLDHVAGAALDDDTCRALNAELRGWTERMAPMLTDEKDRMFGRVHGVAGHGQTLCPAFAIDHQDDTSLDGHVTFGEFHHGANGAAHGGAVALLFDEVLGIPANANVPTMARTAYLHVNFRAITPIDRLLQVSARVTSIEGRKRFVRGEIRDGDTLCADAEGLFLELLPGQQ